MLAKALWVAIAPFVVEAFTSIGSARIVNISPTSVDHYGWDRAAVSSDKSGFESGPAAVTTVAAAVRDSDLDQFRDLDAILTERAARFYASSSSSREREKCILVGMCMLELFVTINHLRASVHLQHVL